MDNVAMQTICIDEAEMLHLMRLYNELRHIHKNITKLCKTHIIESERLGNLIYYWNDTVSQLQETVYLIRCVPVGTLFKRLASVARSILKEKNQQVFVQTDGHDISLPNVF